MKANDGSKERLIEKIRQLNMKFEIDVSKGKVTNTKLSGANLWKVLINLDFEGLFETTNLQVPLYVQKRGGRNFQYRAVT